MKDYLTDENARNKTHAKLYAAMLKKALGNVDVLIGHHLTYEMGGDLDTECEIPSADTLLFDHDLMGRIFGERAMAVMVALATTPAEGRDAMAAMYFSEVK